MSNKPIYYRAGVIEVFSNGRAYFVDGYAELSENGREIQPWVPEMDIPRGARVFYNKQLAANQLMEDKANDR